MQTTDFDIESLPVKIEYVGETVRDGDWRCDQWRVTISNKSGQWVTDYFTGLGHRKVTRRGNCLGMKNAVFVRGMWEESKPVKPKIIGVLHSLFMDAQASDQNFIDWCADFGYSDDSMKAFNTYRQCCETGLMLRKYFDPKTREAIQAAIEDY